MSRVIVIGGGIGGLTAAHELAERDLEVSVLEAGDRFGGKARSMPITEEPDALHGEHGFRFFPAFYRHVVDTMARIPDGTGTVEDNLVATEATLIAGVEDPDRIADTRSPDSLRGWLEALRPAFADDLPARDARFLLERLAYLLTSCQRRREEELDEISWWDFIDADARSPEFRKRVANTTQALVALRPQHASARTVGTIYLQLLFGQLDPNRPTERILNAPTNEAWIDPWSRYLEDLGVELRPGTPVTGLEVDGRQIAGVTLENGETLTAEEYVLAVPVEVAPKFVTPELTRVAPELGRIERLETAWMNGVQFYLSEDVPLTRGHQVYADSPWALTSISQAQFWTDYDLTERDPAVEGVLSVIASDWESPGIVYGKPARECTREEVVTEIWEQLKAHLNRPAEVLSDDHLVEWFLDPAIVESGDSEGQRGDDTAVENRSPLLINTVGSLKNRPPADVAVENLTLASDYVRTNSDLASMESANEAGRRAANAILERQAVSGSRAQIWELREPVVFEPPKREDAIRYRLGLPHPAEVTQSVRSVATAAGALFSRR